MSKPTKITGSVDFKGEGQTPSFEWNWDAPANRMKGKHGKLVELAFGDTIVATFGKGWPKGSRFYHVLVAGPKEGGGWEKDKPRAVWDWKDGGWKQSDGKGNNPGGAAELKLDVKSSTQSKLIFINDDDQRDEGMIFDPMVLDDDGNKWNPDPEVILRKNPTSHPG